MKKRDKFVPFHHTTIWLTVFILFCFILTLALYWPGFYGPFILDDLPSIQPTQMEVFSWQKLWEICLKNESGPLGRPLSVMSFALNHYFFGSQPFYFKVINFGLHSLIGLCAGFFIYLLTLVQPRSKRFALPVACLTTLLWLIHPLQVTTVLYAVQRMTQLCHFFILSGLIFYLWGRIRLLTKKKYSIPLMASSVIIFFPLALLSKETGILMPWYLLCTEYFILKFYCHQQKEKKILISVHAVLSITVLFLLISYYLYSLPKFLSFFAEKESSPLLRFLTELKVLMLYLKMIFLPQIGEMGFYHDDFPLSTGLDGSTMLAAIFVFGLCVLTIGLRRIAPIIAFGLAWFFISHAIESTFLPLELVFEHRNYLALLGLMWIPGYYLVVIGKKATQPIRYSIWGVSAGIVAILTMLTFLRSENWSADEKILFMANINHPNSPRVHIELANFFLAQNQYQPALMELDIAQKLQPNNIGIMLHKMLIHCHAQKLPTEFYEQIAQNIQQKAITPYAIMVLDTLVFNLFNDQCAAIDPKNIIPLLQKAQQNAFLVYRTRYKATLYQLEAALQLQIGQVNQSRALLLKSFETYPKYFDPLLQKAKIELLKGRPQEARATLKYIQQQAAHSLYAPHDDIAKLTQEILTKKE